MKPGGWALLAAGGVLYALGNVGWGLWPLAFICLVPLWQSIHTRRHSSSPGAAGVGLVYGAAAYAAGFGWLWPLAGQFVDSVWGAALLWLAYGAWFALGFGVYALCSQWLLRRGCPWWASLTAPLLLLEAWQVGLFPAYLGAGLVHTQNIAQLAGLGGVLLLSAFAIYLNGCIYHFVSHLQLRQCLISTAQAGLVLFVAATYGYAQLQGKTPVSEQVPVNVGIVQNNVVRASTHSAIGSAEFAKATHQRNLELSRRLLQQQAIDVLVWPESAYSRALRRPLPLDAQMIRRDLEVPLLFGATSNLHHEGRAMSANSLFLSDRQGRIEQVYDKQKLLPFAETVPDLTLPRMLEDRLPETWLQHWSESYLSWLGALFPWHQRFMPGPAEQVLTLGPLRMATPICFELIDAAYVRQLVRGGAANMIVSIANDAWFGRSQEPFMHLALARMRAIEHGVWVVRATNSGISALINPRGQVVAQTGLFREQTLSGTVYPRSADTLYSRHGDWVASFAGGLLLVVALMRRFRRSTRAVPLAAGG